MQIPTAQPRQDASAMKGLIEIVTSLVSFDVVLLRERLATLDCWHCIRLFPASAGWPMRKAIDIAGLIFGFDLLRLRGRLAGVENADIRALVIVFSMLADALRFVALTALFALVLV
jgi:hypothetical protein